MSNLTNRPGAYVFPLGTDELSLVDEGNYFCVTTGQSGMSTGATSSSFAAGNPFVVVFNKAAAGGPNIYFDFLALCATAAGNAGANCQAAGVIDTGNRYTSGGAELTTSIVNPNGNSGNSSNARVYAGAIVATAATSTARTIFGNRFLSGAIPVAGDTYVLKFGGNESVNSTTKNTVTFTNQNVPKMVIPPQSSGLVYLWLASQTGASAFIPDMAWCER